MKKIKILFAVLFLSVTGSYAVYNYLNPVYTIVINGEEFRVREFTPNSTQVLRATSVLITQGDGLGSGTIVSPEGVIVTCEHVVPSSTATIYVKANNTNYKASILYRDKSLDLAVLKITSLRPLYYAKLGGTIQHGEDAIAIGNPLGIEKFVSKGIISKKILFSDGRVDYYFDAMILPGSSGGGLFNAKGELVAVTGYMIPAPRNMGQAISGGVAVISFKAKLLEIINNSSKNVYKR